MLEITQGLFKRLCGYFEKLQTLSDGFDRALLLVEVGFRTKLINSTSSVKKSGHLIYKVTINMINRIYQKILEVSGGLNLVTVL